MSAPTVPPAAALAALNGMAPVEFVAALADIVEHSPWVAEAVLAQRPFDTLESLHAAMLAAIERAPREVRIALARLHPELAGQEAAAGTLTAASNVEQSRLGLTSLSRADHARLTSLNRAYREKFGFPFITAVRLHADLASIFAALERRCAHDPETELAETVRQIGEVMRGRLIRRFGDAAGLQGVPGPAPIAGSTAGGGSEPAAPLAADATGNPGR
jgi:2-oxo-4-hydroxy-4-carboxy-5-ureidoimidazoline decarboxylase